MDTIEEPTSNSKEIHELEKRLDEIEHRIAEIHHIFLQKINQIITFQNGLRRTLEAHSDVLIEHSFAVDSLRQILRGQARTMIAQAKRIATLKESLGALQRDAFRLVRWISDTKRRTNAHDERLESCLEDIRILVRPMVRDREAQEQIEEDIQGGTQGESGGETGGETGGESRGETQRGIRKKRFWIDEFVRRMMVYRLQELEAAADANKARALRAAPSNIELDRLVIHMAKENFPKKLFDAHAGFLLIHGVPPPCLNV